MVELASHILDKKAGHFDPAKFKDEYELALRKLVKRKAAGKTIEAAGADRRPLQRHRSHGRAAAERRARRESRAGKEEGQRARRPAQSQLERVLHTMAWKILKTAVDQWFQHRSARLGAALAYYSVFSMGPLLLIVTSVAGFFFGAEAVRGSLIGAVQIPAR